MMARLRKQQQQQIMSDKIQQFCSHSQLSQVSIDSSQVLSESLTLESVQLRAQQLPQVSFEANQNQQHHAIWSPIQLPRFGLQNRQSDMFGNFQHQFIGFVGLGKKDKGKAIQVNQSKLKEAKKFLDLGSSQKSDAIFLTTSVQKTIDLKKEHQDLEIDSDSTQSMKDIRQPLFPEFSVGFKSLGTGKAIHISEESTNQVKLLFSDFDLSQKETKSKIGKEEVPKREKFPQNLTKTQKIKPFPHPKNISLSAKNSLASQMSDNRKILDRSTAKLGQKYHSIKLQDLKGVSRMKVHKFQFYLKQQRQIFNTVGLIHQKDGCTTTWCYFCKKYQKELLIINKQFLLKQLGNLVSAQQSTKCKLPKIVDLILFKLAKYSFFYPAIKNKQLIPNNFLLQVYKKVILLQKQLQSPLELSLPAVASNNGKNLGKHITLVIVSINLAEQMDMFFVELSDGWTSVYGILTNSNQMYHLIGKKLLVGSKIRIVNWAMYPVSNILEFHPDKQVAGSKAICIQFNYNNSMPAQFRQKLGWPKQLFYRPVNKCKQSGGSIPLVEGIVVRMFTIKNSKNISASYLQILLPEGACILMKVALSEQVSLVELFRLYYCYHFLNIKKLSQMMLQFVANSKFHQIQDKQRLTKVKKLFQDRLLNIYSHRKSILAGQITEYYRQKTRLSINKQILQLSNNSHSNSRIYANQNQNILQSNSINSIKKRVYVDVVTKAKQIQIDDFKIMIQQKIEGTILLQQYLVSITPEGLLLLSRGDRGSCLKRIPKIYDSIQYKVF